MVSDHNDYVNEDTKERSLPMLQILENHENMKTTATQININSQQKAKTLNRSIIGTGQASNFSIKGSKQLVHLHICRVDPEVTEGELILHLNQNRFSDVQCSKLESKRPEEYSSFKISVPRAKIEKIKNPEIWPEGVQINPFLFHLWKRNLISK